MFGVNYVKFEPSEFVIKYKSGRLEKEGKGLAFYYYAPITSVIVVPTGSRSVPFIFEETTKDFQSITIQGEVNFKIEDSKKLSGLLNYDYNLAKKTYLSEDPLRLNQKVVNLVRVQTKKIFENMALKDALQCSETLAEKIIGSLVKHEEGARFGLEFLSVLILSILPNKETARALEADARENILRKADEALYIRRNAAIEQERIIKENELNTQIALEEKNRQVVEKKMANDQFVQEKKNSLHKDQMEFEINQEEMKKSLVDFEVANMKVKSDAKIDELAKSVEAINLMKNETIKALASAGMDASQLIAIAFQDLAGNAAKIGELNISPDLLKNLLKSDR